MTFRWRFWLILLAPVLFSTQFAGAEPLTERLKADFRPIAGYVVMARDGEYLIDLDQSAGIRVGDLFSVRTPGKEITHPTTGKVIGTVTDVKGVLKVTRLDEGFSHARALGKADTIKRGDRIERYEGIRALFWDYGDADEATFLALRNAMPALKWAELEAARKSRPKTPGPLGDGEAALLFILSGDALEVRDSEFQMIRAYARDGVPLAAAPTEPPVRVTPTPPPSPPAAKVETEMAPPPVDVEVPEAKTPTYQDSRIVGKLPTGTRAADFLRHDGKLLMATCDGNRVRVFEVQGDEPVPVAEREIPADAVHAVRWWFPESAASPMIAVNGWEDESLQSAVLAFNGGELETKHAYIPYFLGGFDADGDGRPETLLRQSFDRDTFWGRRIEAVRLRDGELDYVAPEIDPPVQFVVTAGALGDLTGDGKPEAIYVRGRNLHIFSGQELLFELRGVGGSIDTITYAVNPTQLDLLTRREEIEIPPLVTDIDGDGRSELIVAASSQATLSAPSLYSGFKSSQLAVLKYRDGNFVRGTIGDALDSPVQGLYAEKDRLLFVLTQPSALFGRDGASNLQAFRIAR